MKKLLVTLTAVLVSVSTFAQGTIFFNNRTSAGDVRIYSDATRTAGAGMLGTVNAQLFLVPAGGGAPVALTPATTFRSGAAASFFVNPVDVTVPGVAAGTSASVIIRAWIGADYATALATGTAGESAPLTIAGLGGVNPQTGAIVPTPDLAGLQPFNLVTVPEPSTIALGVLGAAALLYRRRK
jgi:hypothetical protein